MKSIVALSLAVVLIFGVFQIPTIQVNAADILECTLIDNATLTGQIQFYSSDGVERSTAASGNGAQIKLTLTNKQGVGGTLKIVLANYDDNRNLITVATDVCDFSQNSTDILIFNTNFLPGQDIKLFVFDSSVYYAKPAAQNLQSNVTQYVLKSKDKNIGVYSDMVYQKRNEHNNFDDLQEEIFMYRKLDDLIDILENVKICKNIKDTFYNIYDSLQSNHIVDEKELLSVELWLKLIK